MQELKWRKTDKGGAYLCIDIAKDAYIHVFIGKEKNMYDYHIDLHTTIHFGIESSTCNKFDIYESDVFYPTLKEACAAALTGLRANLSELINGIIGLDESCVIDD